MASVTKETDNWNVDISPGEEITLTMAQTYVDRDINVKAAAASTPGDGTLTIQKNGTNVATFTANQSENTTANITVPTKVSDLTNDSGFTSNAGTVTSVAVKMNGATKGTVTSSGTIDLGTVITDISGKIDNTDVGLSGAINKLGEGSSNATRNDYIVAQYANGGTTTTSYHRRKLSNIFAALNKSDITTALGYTPPTTDTNTWRPLGTTADTACAGNDSRLSDARTAKDYNSTTGGTVQIGYAGNSATADEATYVAVYKGGPVIKDMSFSDLKTKLGIGSLITSSGGLYAKGDHDLMSHSNEFNFAPTGLTNIWFNYRASSGNKDGTITSYYFGDGKGSSLAYISSDYFSGKANYTDKLLGVDANGSDYASTDVNFVKAVWTSPYWELRTISNPVYKCKVGYAEDAGIDYSTAKSKEVAIGKWHNGKTLYRYVGIWSSGSKLTATSTQFWNVTSLKIESLVTLKAGMGDASTEAASGTKYILSDTSGSEGGQRQIFFRRVSGVDWIYINASDAASSTRYVHYVIVEYTKHS